MLCEPAGSVKQVAGTSRAVSYWCCTPESGRASCRWGPRCTTITPANFVIIMKAVGRSVAFLSHPGKGVQMVSTCLRIVRAIKRQSSSANNKMRPKASMRSGFFRNRLLTITGSFRNP
jgi:hypothetical protein